jgi:hypothetical protein
MSAGWDMDMTLDVETRTWTWTWTEIRGVPYPLQSAVHDGPVQ